MTVTPRSRSVRMIRNSLASSLSVNAAEGSSMISTEAVKDRAFTISTTCCSTTDSSSTLRSTSSSMPISARRARVRSRAAFRSRWPRRPAGSRFRKTFSATVKPRIRLNSWKMMLMPASWASRGLRKATGSPFSVMRPSSAW